jgi:hypothetical protein
MHDPCAPASRLAMITARKIIVFFSDILVCEAAKTLWRAQAQSNTFI